MKISVVVPSYQQAAYLPLALESVCSQDHADTEVLVFDGGSTDGSAEILANGRFAAGNPSAGFRGATAARRTRSTRACAPPRATCLPT